MEALMTLLDSICQNFMRNVYDFPIYGVTHGHNQEQAKPIVNSLPNDRQHRPVI